MYLKSFPLLISRQAGTTNHTNSCWVSIKYLQESKSSLDVVPSLTNVVLSLIMNGVGVVFFVREAMMTVKLCETFLTVPLRKLNVPLESFVIVNIFILTLFLRLAHLCARWAGRHGAATVAGAARVCLGPRAQHWAIRHQRARVLWGEGSVS